MATYERQKQCNPLPISRLRIKVTRKCVFSDFNGIRKIVIANIPFHCIFMWSDERSCAHEDIDSATKRDSKFSGEVGSTHGG
jgi:hypothetical protein